MLARAQAQGPAPVEDPSVQLALDLGDAPGEVVPSGLPEMTSPERVRAELEVLGLDVSRHVVDFYVPMMRSIGVTRARDLLGVRSRGEVLVAGVKVATQTPPVRSGRRVVFLTLDDATGPVDATFFEDAQGPYAATVFHSWLLLVRGEVRRTGPRGVSVRATGCWELGAVHDVWRSGGPEAVLDLIAGDPLVDPADPTDAAVEGMAGSRASRPVTSPSAPGVRRVAGCWSTPAGSGSPRTPTSSRPATARTTSPPACAASRSARGAPRRKARRSGRSPGTRRSRRHGSRRSEQALALQPRQQRMVSRRDARSGRDTGPHRDRNVRDAEDGARPQGGVPPGRRRSGVTRDEPQPDPPRRRARGPRRRRHRRTILHVDMDAFYASVSLLDHPGLVGQPVIVGATGGRGVVLSATYEARALGVHSAMPMSRAMRLCPQAVVLPPEHRRYTEVSAAVMEIFRSITPLVEPLSLDEAFLDVAGVRRLWGPPRTIGDLIRARVHDEQGITCSVGVASTKFVAKLASTRIKPDGLLVVPRDEVVAFLHPLPVGALWGVGEKTEEVLRRLGLVTVGDLAHTPVRTLTRALGPAAGEHLAALAWGRDDRAVVAARAGPQHRGGGDLLPRRRRPRGGPARAAAAVREGGPAAAPRRARRADGVDQGAVRRLHHHHPVADAAPIRPTSPATSTPSRAALFEALGLQRARLRLVGVRVEGLLEADDAPRQLLLDAREHGWRDAERAVDRAAERFGRDAVRPARLVPVDPDDPAPRGARGRPGNS